jgi:Putative metallopeptidase
MKLFFRILALLLLLLPCLSAHAASGPVLFNVDVPAGTWKAVRLKNLPRDAAVAVQVESNGEILVALLDSTSKGKPDTSRPLFAGRLDKQLSFSISVTVAGDHYLVFDNRTGKESRAVKATVRAARGSSDQMEAANKILRDFERKLHQIFVFEPFPMAIQKCGPSKAFVESPGVIVCAEYVYQLHALIKDKEKTRDALSFSIFHEVARVLLAKWDHPFRSDKDVADEFATVLIIMVNQKERALGAASYFSQNSSTYYAMKKFFQDERHPLSPERAKNILVWLKDKELARKWQEILVPHMQTALLKRLQQRPTPWTDLPLLEKELANRNSGKKIPL